MTGKFNLYGIYKRWTAKDSGSTQKKEVETFNLQTANLVPVFDSKTNQFASVYFKAKNDCRNHNITELIKRCLRNINYWQCHGRAIRCTLPAHYSELIAESTINQIEELLVSSKLPVGLIAIVIIDLDEKIYSLIEFNLHRLKRLGVVFEILKDPTAVDDLAWLPRSLFEGMHIQVSEIRQSYQDKKHCDELGQLIEKINSNNFHKYCGDIALVHDLIFAKNIGIDFCYGPLMMNTVSEHQILKIKESQFANLKIDPTPSLHLHDGEHR